MIRCVLSLIGGSLALWLVVALPARQWGGDQALVYSATAMLLCLLPGVATSLWAEWTRRRIPEQMPIAVLGGTAVRMVFVLGAGLLVYVSVPYFHQTSYWIWLLVSYLLTLALEIGLLVSGKPAAAPDLGGRNTTTVDNVKP